MLHVIPDFLELLEANRCYIDEETDYDIPSPVLLVVGFSMVMCYNDCGKLSGRDYKLKLGSEVVELVSHPLLKPMLSAMYAGHSWR